MDATAMKAAIFGDLERELKVTRSVLAAVPMEKGQWQPHEKSMCLMKLAIHVADMPEWTRVALDDEGINFQVARRPPSSVDSTKELLAYFDEKAEGLRAAVKKFEMARWGGTWAVKNGEQVLTVQPRATVYRIWCMNHMVHHRGQLNVYLRLLNVPVPTIYFNSADDPSWQFD